MDEEQRRLILINLNTVKQEKILELINANEFTFEDLQQSGNFAREKQDWVQKELRKKEKQKDIEKEFWEECLGKNTLISLNEYMNAYPDGLYVNVANAKIGTINDELVKGRDFHYTKMQEYPYYSSSQLENLLNENKIIEEDLIDKGIFTKKALRAFLNPPKFNSKVLEWNDLPPLPDNHTDVYFFGIPRSGKSSVLAGLFHYAEKKGLITPNTSSKEGITYYNILKESVNKEYVIPSTPTDSVNYITAKLTYDNKQYPMSIIEISGEYFKDTYRKGDLDTNENTIGANGYLQNENSKIIFLVIDYAADNEGQVDETMGDIIATQQDLLMNILLMLEDDGTLEKTVTIQIIVTKTDKMDLNNGSVNEQTEDYINTNYLNLINNIKILNNKYDINKVREHKAIVLPFSLGIFMLGKVYEYDSTDSAFMLASLLNGLPPEKSQTGFIPYLNNLISK